MALIAYFLREKHNALKMLEGRVVSLETRAAVNDEGNKNRDAKMELMDKKLDRVLEKLGA